MKYVQGKSFNVVSFCFSLMQRICATAIKKVCRFFLHFHIIFLGCNCCLTFERLVYICISYVFNRKLGISKWPFRDHNSLARIGYSTAASVCSTSSADNSGTEECEIASPIPQPPFYWSEFLAGNNTANMSLELTGSGAHAMHEERAAASFLRSEPSEAQSPAGCGVCGAAQAVLEEPAAASAPGSDDAAAFGDGCLFAEAPRHGAAEGDDGGGGDGDRLGDYVSGAGDAAWPAATLHGAARAWGADAPAVSTANADGDDGGDGGDGDGGGARAPVGCDAGAGNGGTVRLALRPLPPPFRRRFPFLSTF